MEPIYIILEGQCGIDTQQNLIVKNIPHRVFHKLHYSSLPFEDKEKHIMHSTKLYDDMFKSISALSKYNINVIFNRSHLSESVHLHLLRQHQHIGALTQQHPVCRPQLQGDLCACRPVQQTDPYRNHKGKPAIRTVSTAFL